MDSSQAHEALHPPLEQMPKDPLPKLALSSGRQGWWLLKWSMLLPVLAGIFWLISRNSENGNNWYITNFVMLALAPSPILLAIMILVWSKIQAHHLKDLIEGNYWIHWTYGPDQWQQIIEESSRGLRWFLPTMVIVFAVMGLILGINFSSSSEGIGGLLPLLLGPLVGALIGTAMGMIQRGLSSMTEKLRRTEPARAVVGPKGIYLTGLFFAGSALGQKVLSAAFPEKKQDRLIFRIQVMGGKGYRIQRLELPIPPGQEEIAREFASQFKRLAGR